MSEVALSPPLGRRDLPWLAGLVALVLVRAVVFRAAGGDYFGFWRGAGPVIGLATAALGWAWGAIDRNTGLVSANPRVYAGAALQLASLPLIAFGGHMQSRYRREPVWTSDLVLILPLGLVYGAAVIAWLVLIAPAQYFAFLAFGAPSRLALASRFRLYARLDAEGQLIHGEGVAGAPDSDASWWDASMRDRPVTMASAFLAAGLGLLQLLRAAF
jgi:hypothetical protein